MNCLRDFCSLTLDAAILSRNTARARSHPSTNTFFFVSARSSGNAAGCTGGRWTWFEPPNLAIPDLPSRLVSARRDGCANTEFGTTASNLSLLLSSTTDDDRRTAAGCSACSFIACVAAMPWTSSCTSDASLSSPFLFQSGNTSPRHHTGNRLSLSSDAFSRASTVSVFFLQSALSCVNPSLLFSTSSSGSVHFDRYIFDSIFFDQS